MPSEENDTDEYHYMTWMMAQQKLLKKLKGRRLAKEEVTLSRHNKCYVCYQFKLTYVFYCISFYLVSLCTYLARKTNRTLLIG